MRPELTLADYIKNTMEKISFEKSSVVAPKDNRYLVYPEKRGEESDEKINPFSEV